MKAKTFVGKFVKTILILVGALALLFILIPVFSGAFKDRQPEPTSMPSIGMNATYQGISIILDEVERTGHTRAIDLGVGQEFVNVKMTIKNDSGKTVTFNSASYKLQTGEGQLIKSTVIGGATDFLTVELIDGGQTTQTISFKVKVDEPITQLHYYGNVLGTFSNKPKLSFDIS